MFLALAWLAPSAVLFADEPAKVKVDLPGFEQGDLYVLGRLSNEELLKMEHSEWVWVAILIREGIDRHHRTEAITKLAQIRKSDEPEQILAGMTRAAKAAGESPGVVYELASLLLLVPPAELAKKREKLIQLSSSADHELVKQTAYAALILTEGKAEAVWQIAKESGGLIDFLNALSLIPERRTLAPLFPVVKSGVQQSENVPLRLAAIRALASIPRHADDVFDLLVPLVGQDREHDAVLQALLQIPVHKWPDGRAEVLAETLVTCLSQADPTRRNSPAVKRARQLGEKLVTLLPAAGAGKLRKTLASLGIRSVTIRAVPHGMKYDRAHLVVQAGRPLEIIFENPDTMSHNLVVVTPGAVQEIGVAASRMNSASPTWKGRSYVPDSPKVLSATRMVHTLQSETLTIVAPEKPGKYAYVCTFPGHWAAMNGTLHVVDDVEAWLAENPEKATGSDPQSRAFVKAWQGRDLTAELKTLDQSKRSLVRGKALFSSATCFACHRMAGEGGTTGPALDDLARRFEDPAALLDEILEPSKTINEAYRISVLELKDGRSVTGTIAKETDDAVHVAGNTLEGTPPTEIARGSILAIKRSDISTMPPGLLNALGKEEILNLLAYLRSAGSDQALQNSEPPN